MNNIFACLIALVALLWLPSCRATDPVKLMDPVELAAFEENAVGFEGTIDRVDELESEQAQLETERLIAVDPLRLAELETRLGALGGELTAEREKLMQEFSALNAKLAAQGSGPLDAVIAALNALLVFLPPWLAAVVGLLIALAPWLTSDRGRELLGLFVRKLFTWKGGEALRALNAAFGRGHTTEDPVQLMDALEHVARLAGRDDLVAGVKVLRDAVNLGKPVEVKA